MKCELCCADDPSVLMLLPLHQPNGSLVTMACEECGKKSKTYCLKHARIHQGFTDGSTACLQCIEELVAQEREKAEIILAGFTRRLPRNEAWKLLEAAETSSTLTGDTIAGAILRFIASKAARTQKNCDQVVGEILRQNSVDCILRC